MDSRAKRLRKKGQKKQKGEELRAQGRGVQVYEIRGSVYNCGHMSSEESEQEDLNSTVVENIGEIIGVKVKEEEEIEKSKGKEAFVTPERILKKEKDKEQNVQEE